MKKRRCAIYTRKSTDEGLDQSFNSLDAQYEACAAYILSQAGEGWTCAKQRYDDGGFSGGNMDRPGLKALMADIEAGRIDIVVVYKVDRLTRALSDFARIVDILDKHEASFVSVTQAFNTTTSMGRLTLNVLLSFAQFEREVTGERIRDKIAASKAKGMWMGGYPPLGYDVRERALHINEEEAETVRAIFRRYLELPGTVSLRDELERTGIRSKTWVSRSGKQKGGAVFSRGGLNYLLRNRTYLGEIAHRCQTYRGQHQAIVPRNLFEAVQQKLDAKAPASPEIESKGRRAMLLGKVFDDAGNAMTSAHGNKRGKRYFYYVSTAINTGKPRGSVSRVSAPKLEAALLDYVLPMLKPDWRSADTPMLRLTRALQHVVLHANHIAITLTPEAVDPAHAALPEVLADEDGVNFQAPLTFKPTQRARTLIASTDETLSPKIDRALVRAIVLARSWAQELGRADAPSLRAIAKRENVCPHYARQILPLAFLAPDLVEALLDGRQTPSLSLSGLIAQPLPVLWQEQRSLFAKFA